MKVAISGASGLIGRALSADLRRDGHDVVALVRRKERSADEIRWDPAARELDPAAFAEVDGVVHLAGAGIADKRWTESRRREILDSRVDGTTTIAQTLAAAPPRARFMVSASAVGWYGDTGDRPVEESEPAGEGFLAEVCERWEAAAQPAIDAGVRVAFARSGLVLSRRGGLMGRLLPLFRLGLGAKLGSGRQYWPWITLTDEISALRFLIDSDLTGPVNLTGPAPVTNAEFTKTLGSVLGRPTLAAVPSFVLKLVVGEFAEEGILAGQRAMPRVLTEAGFKFTAPTLRDALEEITAS
ncbi:MAG: TIGR01777 family protein [Geodermatophilaceae bacterium]|nr:TIGR01777 family protein [Geodermatophilaceae bacterium]